MSFAHPLWLWLLLLLFPYMLFSALSLRRMRQFVEALDGHTRSDAAASPPRKAANNAGARYLARRRLSAWSGGALLVCMVLVLADPALGLRYLPERVRESELVFLLDVSNSMLLPEGESNRLDRAKQTISQISEHFPSSYYSLTIFKGDSMQLVPPTAVRQAFLDTLVWALPESMTQAGTSLDSGLNSLLTAAASSASRLLLVLSDGHASAPVHPSLIEELGQQFEQLLFIGFGSEEALPLSTAEGVALRDAQGRVVRLNQNASYLRELAEASGGHYLDASAKARPDLSVVAEQAAALLRDRLRPSGAITLSAEPISRSWIFIAAAVFFFVLSVLSSSPFYVTGRGRLS
ncbi:MAG: VWA domain-containing protein [Spirochaetes bacterium]|nr:VWA domain-containing protein [Spirochaetota bacterium]MBU0954992.1 VWA domain-containing protein [Spirochaetota bacterium]